MTDYKISPDFDGKLPELKQPILVAMMTGWIDASALKCRLLSKAVLSQPMHAGENMVIANCSH